MTDDTIARTSKERSPADYAIEHGQYLAKSAEDFLTLLNDVAMAESALETWDEDDSEYAAAKARVDEAWEKRHDHWQGLQNAIYEFRKRAERVAPETCATPERPFAWYRERVPVGYHIHVGDWPPPEPDDTAWQPLYLTPGGIPAKETGGRLVRPHRSGGQPVASAFRDERLHRIDKLMDAQPGTNDGAELDKLVDEQVNAEKAGEQP